MGWSPAVGPGFRRSPCGAANPTVHGGINLWWWCFKGTNRTGPAL